ncbi:hypothetical protein [Microbacterium oleivorans]|uniref:DUF3168 domain-containing protein n=1 Tax=Microbacterium oleivorans TaxID=273677 RepID=A0A7D5F5U2_9MICO|nr:hypothetical protein [Microbacterium oleivorans]QLD10893.1 hypothetical protein HW566_03295 [Microbacterium oleivorans]
MFEPAVIHTDLELFLTGWYRNALAARPEDVCRGVVVDNREQDGPDFPERSLIIRDDGGPDTSLLTGRRTVGLSVLAGSPENPQDAADLALIVHALRTQIPSIDPDNPVSRVRGSLGPYRVPESQPRARRYMAFTLDVVGKAL